jgi:hypothetical protein
MPRLNCRSTINSLVTLVLLAGGCRHTTVLPERVPPEERFARDFIRVLQDSGSVAILPLTTPKTRALRNFARNMDVLRSELAASHTTLTLARWNAIPAKGDVPKLIHIVYTVQRADGPSELALWIEEASGHYLLNTISIGPPNPDSAR